MEEGMSEISILLAEARKAATQVCSIVHVVLYVALSMWYCMWHCPCGIVCGIVHVVLYVALSMWYCMWHCPCGIVCVHIVVFDLLVYLKHIDVYCTCA